MSSIFRIEVNNWNEIFQPELQEDAINALENGKVLFFPNLKFEVTEKEKPLFKEGALSLQSKTLKYNKNEDKLWGAEGLKEEAEAKQMLKRYATLTTNLASNLLPFYKNTMQVYNSSFRPIEAEGRSQSKRHDDTRLHLDAFPSRPTGGKRLLRIFANVNQEGKPRVWNVGESFENVMNKFLPQIGNPLPFSSCLLKMFKITKSKRTHYDHIMLNLHDKMKLDEEYQKNVLKENFPFPAGCVWICYSDSVSHAVLSGRCLLEQTIMMEPKDMKNPELSPLFILEKRLNKTLI